MLCEPEKRRWWWRWPGGLWLHAVVSRGRCFYTAAATMRNNQKTIMVRDGKVSPVQQAVREATFVVWGGGGGIMDDTGGWIRSTSHTSKRFPTMSSIQAARNAQQRSWWCQWGWHHSGRCCLSFKVHLKQILACVLIVIYLNIFLLWWINTTK